MRKKEYNRKATNVLNVAVVILMSGFRKINDMGWLAVYKNSIQ
jgi:hypothetical protein